VVGDRLCLILGGEEISAATWKDDRKRGRYIGHMGDAMIEITRGCGAFDGPTQIPGKGEVYVISVTQPQTQLDEATATLTIFAGAGLLRPRTSLKR
jgi:hypothetical protein